MIDVIGGIRTPRCDCRPNTQDELCENQMCDSSNNEIPPAAFDGNPCQNAREYTATTQSDNTQVCCVIIH